MVTLLIRCSITADRQSTLVDRNLQESPPSEERQSTSILFFFVPNFQPPHKNTLRSIGQQLSDTALLTFHLYFAFVKFYLHDCRVVSVRRTAGSLIAT